MRPGQFTHAPCDKRITELESELASLRSTYDEFVKSGETETVKKLKEGLKRLRWRWTPDFYGIRADAGGPTPGLMYCLGCGESCPCSTAEAKYPTCKPDCWVAELLK